MNYSLGIDLGATFTKLACVCDNKLVGTVKIVSGNPAVAAEKVLHSFAAEYSVSLHDISSVRITGAGASYLGSRLNNINLVRIDEMSAMGVGGRFLSEIDNIIIANIGTGTAFVSACGSEIKHLGGSGIGGGTIVGLGRKMLGIADFATLSRLAAGGCAENVDMTIGDISKTIISNMPLNITAANFAKLSDNSAKHDIAAGIFNLVFQTVGVMSAFAAKSCNISNVVLTGGAVCAPFAERIFSEVAKLHKNISFIIPQNPDFATAIGAAAADIS